MCTTRHLSSSLNPGPLAVVPEDPYLSSPPREGMLDFPLPEATGLLRADAGGGTSVVELQPDAGTVEMRGRLSDTVCRPSKLLLGREFLRKILAPDMGSVWECVRVHLWLSVSEVQDMWECQDCKQLGLNLLNGI